MDKADIASVKIDVPENDGTFISVSRQAYEAMEAELARYRALYGALPAADTVLPHFGESEHIEAATSAASVSSASDVNPSDAILSILSQDDSALRAESLEDLEASLLSMQSNEVIRHYGFKRVKMNHR